ncbi:hypothetical protein GCM10027298_24070 [Epidermidibacterium keratini]
MREDWLRFAGLPLVLPPSVRLRALLRRTAPVTWGLALVATAMALAAQVGSELEGVNVDTVALDDPRVLRSLVGLGLLVAAVPVAWAVTVVMRRAPRPVQIIIALAAIAALVAGPSLVGLGDWPPTWWVRALALLAVWLVTYAGIGTILGWIARRGLRSFNQIGVMATRVLPLLVVATMFFFYNAEIWQVAVNLSLGRSVLVSSSLLLIAVVLIAVGMRDQLAELRENADRSDRPRGPDVLLARTPFEPVSPDAAPPLRYGERVNLLLVPVFAQLLQVLAFTLLVTTFFVLFGMIAIPEQTAAQWIGGPTEELPGLLARLPGSFTLIKVALLLGAFAGLSFAASSASDALYREEFVHPIVDELETGLAARDAYVVAYRAPEDDSTVSPLDALDERPRESGDRLRD